MPTSRIHQVALFASLPHDRLHQLEESLQDVDLPAGSLIFKEGEPGDSFYILLEGEIEIVKALGSDEEHLLAVRGPGSFVGEMGLLVRDGLRTASVRTKTPVHLLKVTTRDFDNLLRNWPDLAREMLRELSFRLRETDNAMIRDLQEKNRELAQAYSNLKAAQEQIIQKEMLERELSMARKIQQSILPRDLPHPPGFDFGARMEPARAVGGDFFDIFPLGRDKYGLVIGDISDKGVPAAIFMALTRSLVRAKAVGAVAPRRVLERVNRLLLEMNSEGMFATVVYGILDIRNREFLYARAGHEAPLVFNCDGERIIPPVQTGQPLGLFPNPPIDQQLLHCPPCGVLLLYTDGIVDALNGQGELFGQDRLFEVIQAGIGNPAQGLCDQILSSVAKFQGGRAQTDDITLVAVRSS